MSNAHIRMSSTRGLLIAAVWCAGGLFDAWQTVLIMRTEGNHHPWGPPFGVELAGWLPWALATPLIIQLARRYPLVRDIRFRGVAMHLTWFAAVSVLAEAWSAWLQVLFNPWGHRKWPTFVDTWTTTLLWQALTFLIAYALIVTVTYLVDARENIARQATETARLNEELSKAQLAALRRQLEPHFIYNTLNSIAGLVRDRQVEPAVNMIVGLSEFLRRASEDSHRSQVTLTEEVEYLERYLQIQKIRFGQRLEASVDVGPALLGAQVPNLLLQPLVENAIKHGISKRIAGGVVKVTGTRQGGTLSLSVYNDGAPLSADWQSGSAGVGIANLRNRLQILYGGASGLELRPAETGGVEVVVTLPFAQVSA